MSEDLKYFNPKRKALRKSLAGRSSFAVTLGDEARESSRSQELGLTQILLTCFEVLVLLHPKKSPQPTVFTSCHYPARILGYISRTQP